MGVRVARKGGAQCGVQSRDPVASLSPRVAEAVCRRHGARVPVTTRGHGQGLRVLRSTVLWTVAPDRWTLLRSETSVPLLYVVVPFLGPRALFMSSLQDSERRGTGGCAPVSYHESLCPQPTPKAAVGRSPPCSGDEADEVHEAVQNPALASVLTGGLAALSAAGGQLARTQEGRSTRGEKAGVSLGFCTARRGEHDVSGARGSLCPRRSRLVNFGAFPSHKARSGRGFSGVFRGRATNEDVDKSTCNPRKAPFVQKSR